MRSMTMDDSDQSKSTSTSIALTTGGITLLGVLLSIGATVGFGITGPWYVRLAAGLVATVALIAIVKLGTSAGRGPIARLARWTIGADRINTDAPGDP
jgi:hypothetical protein